jgi:hypothetical protein
VVSGRGADRAPRMNMLITLALVALLLLRVASLNIIVVPTVFVGALEFIKSVVWALGGN